MSTKVYGASDDLIEFEGDVYGESNVIFHDEDEEALVFFSDGTLLGIKYGKPEKAIWVIRLIERGPLFQRIDPCTDDEADPYSDQAFFMDGLRWAYVASQWERVK